MQAAPSPICRALALGLLTAAIAAPALADPISLTILHMNDFDRMEESEGSGGFARLMAVIGDEQAKAAGTVLVTHGGDAISPSLLSGFDNGAHIVDLLNQTPLALFVPGNHEFDFGPDVATQRFAEARFPIVASNASRNGAAIAGTVETHTIDVGGYTLGFLGLTTPDTAELASPGDVTFAPVLETAARLAEQLRNDGADLIVALSHNDITEDLALIRSHTVDLILGGHDHILMTYYDGETAFVESASQADYVTAVDLTMDMVGEGEEAEFVWTPSFRTLNTANYAPNAAMAAKVQTYLDELSSALDIEIGTTETALDSRRSAVRTGETAIGNLIADAMREAVGADIAITNGGGIRADREYRPGTVLTRRDIQSELPFGNKTVKLEVAGAQILAALENGFSQIEEVGGRFPQISGMTVRVDPGQPAGSRVRSVMVGNAPLDPDRTYTVATNDYMAGGGDGYTAFEGGRNLIDPAAANLMASQVIDHIERAGTISPKIEGRITAN